MIRNKTESYLQMKAFFVSIAKWVCVAVVNRLVSPKCILGDIAPYGVVCGISTISITY